MLESGNLYVLFQPAELLIVGVPAARRRFSPWSMPAARCPWKLRPSFLDMETAIKRAVKIPPVAKPNLPEAADAQAFPA